MKQTHRLPLLAGIVVLLLATAFATAAFAQAPDPEPTAPPVCPMTGDEAACPMTGNGQAACPMTRGAGVCPAMRGNGVCPAHAGQDGDVTCPMAGGMTGHMQGMMSGSMRGMMGRFGMIRGWTAPQGEQGPAWQMPGGCPMHQNSGTTLQPSES